MKSMDGVVWLLRRLGRLNSMVFRQAWRGFVLRRKGLGLPQRYPEDVCREAQCCFVLSTGRCGTAMLTRALARFSELDLFHLPSPELTYSCRFVYWGQGGEDGARLAALCSRYELVRDSHCSGGRFVETNNRVTFFAPALAEVFPRSTFVHLVRHPGKVVRSGLARGYYAGGPVDEGRIYPYAATEAAKAWDGWSRMEKCAWMWNATNAFIEDFKATLPSERVLTVRSEDLFAKPEALDGIAAFLGQEPFGRVGAERLQACKVNAQRGERRPPFDQWSDEDRHAVARLVPLAHKYGYSL